MHIGITRRRIARSGLIGRILSRPERGVDGQSANAHDVDVAKQAEGIRKVG